MIKTKKIASARALLRKIANFFARNAAHWTTDSFAKDDEGSPVVWDDPNAVCYCTTGAMGHFGTIRASIAAQKLLKQFLGEDSIPQWNDAQKSPKPIIIALRKAARLGA